MENNNTMKELSTRDSEVVYHRSHRADDSWRFALEKSGVGIWDWDIPKDEFVYSQKLNQMLGHCNASIVSAGWLELVHPEDVEEAKMHLSAIFEEGDEKSGAEYRVRCADGTHKWVHVTVITRGREHNGRPSLVTGLVSDVTRYREVDHRFRRIAETIPASIFIIQDGCICYVNRHMELTLGYSNREFLSMYPWDCIHAKTRDRVREWLLSCTQGDPIPSHYEIRLVAKDGQEFMGDMSATTITYRGKQAIVGFVYDITERKRTEERLRESESKYKALFENANYAVFLMNGPRIAACNEKTLQLFRCNRTDIIGKTPCDLSPVPQPGDESWVKDNRERIAQAFSSTAQYFECKHRRFDGTIFDAEVSLVRVDLDHGRFLHCTIRDITDQKTRREALRESEQKFRDLAEKSLAGIYLIQDGVFRYVNPRFAEILKYEPHELIETIQHEETLLPEDRAAVLERLGKRTSGQIPSMHHMFRVVTKSGQVRNVEVYGTRTIYRGKPAVIGTLLDITERVRSEELLRQAEEKYRGIFENAAEGIFQTSPSHKPLMVNNALLKMFGYDKLEEFISNERAGEGGFFVNPSDRKELFRRVEKEGGIKGFEAEQYRRDGKHIWVSFNSTAVRGTDGSIIRYDGTIEDITERKEAEEKLRRSEAGLRALVGSMNDSIIVADTNGRYVELNLESPDALNISLSGPFEKLLKETLPGDTIAPFLAAVRKTLKTCRTVRIQYRVHSHGEERWFSSAISPMTNESVVCVTRDITDLKMAEKELHTKSLSLEETNSALRVLLRNVEESKKELENSVISNIRVLVMPHVRKLARFKLDSKAKAHAVAIETNLENIASPLLHNLNQFNLTPTEIQVANYVRDGRTTKEIIELMHGTKDSIDMHRYHIRKKLHINRTKTNLRSYLLSLH